MPNSLITITLSDAELVSVTPGDLSVTVETGSTYLASFLPAQGYRVRVADSLGWDSGPTAGMVTHDFVPTGPTLSINAVAERIPITATTVSLVDITRYYAGEAIPSGGSEADTFFTDGFIGGVVLEAGGNVLRAAGQLWRMKAAEYAKLIDKDEAGSVRKYTQRFKQAMQMADTMETSAVKLDDSALASVRVAGKPVHLARRPGEEWRVRGEFFDSGFLVVEQEFVFAELPPLTLAEPHCAPI